MQSRPCGLCTTPVPQEEFRAGAAKVIGGTLLCPRCAVVIERAQSVTREFGESLPPGSSRPCADCGDVVGVDDILSGGVIYEQGELACRRCAVGRFQKLAEKRTRAASERLERVAEPAPAVAPAAPRSPSGRTPRAKSGRQRAESARQPERSASGRRAPRPTAASGKHRASRTCPTCDGPGGAFRFGKQQFCEACGAVFTNLLAASQVPRGSSAPCKVCSQPATGNQALRVAKDSYCENCRHSAELLIQLQVREQRTAVRRQRAAPTKGPILAILGLLAVGGGGAVAWTLGSGTSAGTGSGSGSDTIAARRSAANDTPERKAFERALNAASATPHGYAHAVEIEKALLAEQAAVASDPRMAEGLQALLVRVREAKRRLVPQHGAALLRDAAREAQAGDYAAAVKGLQGFPAELVDTPTGKRVAEARERHAARSFCEERGRGALSSPAAGRELLIDGLLASVEAQRCGFAQTELGRRLRVEKRRLANARVLQKAKRASRKGPKGKKPPSPARLLKQATQHERKGKLLAAARAYERILDVDPFDSEAIMGRARVALGRERFLQFAEQTRRSARLAPDGSKSLQAWLAHLSGDRDQGRALIKGLKTQDPLVRRLRPILALGDPLRVDGPLRAFGKVPNSRLEAVWPTLLGTVQRVSTALRLPEGGSRLDVFLFKDSKSRAAFFKRVGRAPDAGGALRGCFAIAPASLDPKVLRRAAADALGRRPVRASQWLLAVLGDALAGVEPKSAERLPLERLEKLSSKQVLADPKALATALAFGRLLRTEQGALALARYAVRRVRDPKAASAELTRVMRTL